MLIKLSVSDVASLLSVAKICIENCDKSKLENPNADWCIHLVGHSYHLIVSKVFSCLYKYFTTFS